jgi:thioredoxin reductase
LEPKSAIISEQLAPGLAARIVKPSHHGRPKEGALFHPGALSRFETDQKGEGQEGVMGEIVDVVVVGAGPYGLSLAAHLSQTNLTFRIFGKALDTWRNHVPMGMKLKSDGFASSLSSPLPGSRLEDYCAANSIPYHETDIPVDVTDFEAYATWFQKTFVPTLDERMVSNLTKEYGLFHVTLDDGEVVLARRVVLAVGITWFSNLPGVLAELPKWAASHSFEHHDMSCFAGNEVVVLGGGSSATGYAAALDEAGAFVRIVARSQALYFHSGPDGTDSSFVKQLKNPQSGIGPGWRSFLCARMPLLFHKMPSDFRTEVVKRHLGPATGWFMRERIEGIKSVLGHTLERATAHEGHVVLDLKDRNTGETTTVTCDHVIASTGYTVDLAKLPFLSQTLRVCIDKNAQAPVLSDNFETSVDGLYMTGPAAANAFGPLLRFMVGAEFAAPRLAAHLRRKGGATQAKRAA